MRNETTALLLSAGLGAVSGIRSMSGVALLSWRQASTRGRTGRLLPRRSVYRQRGNGRIAWPASLVSADHADDVATTLAAGEMAADKLFALPPRTDFLSLGGRSLLGALSGLIVAELMDGDRGLAALVGGLSAVASAHLFYRLRKLVTEEAGVPDWLVGLAEDALVLLAGKNLVDQIR